jgi:hypothetical protein
MNKVICAECGYSDVRKLASVYSAGTGGVLSEKSESFSGTNASGVAIIADPSQKMANLGWTLSMLLWTPIISVFILVAMQQFIGGRSWQENTARFVALLSAAIVAFAAWSIPARLERRRADGYTGQVWRPGMKSWHDAWVCLNCGKVCA